MIKEDIQALAKEQKIECGWDSHDPKCKEIEETYDKEHPHAEDLKRKGFAVGTEIPMDLVSSDAFLDAVSERMAEVSPWNAFLADALGLAH